MGFGSIVKACFTSTGKFIRKNASKLLTITTVGGVLSTAGLAINDTRKAQKAIEELQDRYPEGERIPKMEVVKTVIPKYIPTIISVVLTSSAAIGNEFLNEKEKAALIGLYSTSEATLMKYKEKMEKIVGPEKTDEVRRELAKDAVKEYASNGPYEHTCMGDIPIIEAWSGRKFTADLDMLRKAANNFNKRIIGGECWRTLNEWYDEIDLRHTDGGNYIGFNIDNIVELKFTSILDDHDRPVAVMEYINRPVTYEGYQW